jgi:predicted molibdopterin-dependent oxidoreductase YjgC
MNAELISKSKQKINISFVTSSYNYFIENNFIDKHFMLYFMNTHYKDFMNTLPPDDLNEYTMNIIDDKINIIEISSVDTILLKKNKYIII